MKAAVNILYVSLLVSETLQISAIWLLNKSSVDLSKVTSFVDRDRLVRFGGQTRFEL